MGFPKQVPQFAYVDSDTILGGGSINDPFRAVASGPGGSTTCFQYTVTGAEPDLMNIDVALPAVRANTNYGVVPAQEQFTNLLGMGVLTASKTVAQFTLSLSAVATVGDVFTFIVQDL